MDEPVAPRDPRQDWELPPLGAIPPVTELDEVTVRVLAPNPSPMTLDGTNTYVIAPPGSGEAVIVDPGPTDPSHIDAVQDIITARDAEVVAIIVTHHHHDHTEASQMFSTRFRAPTLAYDPAYSVKKPGTDRIDVLRDGSVVELTGCHITAVATPGHTNDHLSLRLATGALLTGDHILGRGTSVVASPEGDLEAYLDSLHTVLGIGPDVLMPGHGPELRDDPSAVVSFYLQQRAYRTAQICAVLQRTDATPRQLVEEIYREVDPKLWPAAERSTRAALKALERRGDISLGPTDVAVWRR